MKSKSKLGSSSETKKDLSKNEGKSFIKRGLNSENKKESLGKVDSIKQYWDEINKLKHENTILKDEIESEIRIGSVVDAKNALRIEKLQESGSDLAKRIEMETKKNKDLNKDIDMTQEILLKRREHTNSSEGLNMTYMQKKMKTLEGRLEKIRQKHNESLAEIKILKEDINMARKERVIYDNVFKNLETDLKNKEEEFKRYLYEKKQVWDNKDFMEGSIDELKKQSENEGKYFDNEFDSVFKSDDRSKSNISRIEKNQNDLDDTTSKLLLDSALINDHSISQPIQITQAPPRMSVYKDKKDSSHKTLPPPIVNNVEYEVLQYEIMFEKLRQDADVKDLDEFIEIFNKQEQENKLLFEKANSLSEEVESLELRLMEKDKEIEKFSENKHASDEIKNYNLQEIENYQEKLRNLNKESESLKKFKTDLEKELEIITKNIPELYHLLECQYINDGIIIDEGLNNLTLLHYLSLIEKRGLGVIDLETAYTISGNNTINNNSISQSKTIEKSGILPLSNITQGGRADEKELNTMVKDLVDGVEIIKESDQIMTFKELLETGKQEINKFRKGKSTVKGKKK